MKGVIIAGTNSGCGKTTVSLGLMALLQQKGYDVAPFKAGPDYIDPAFHTKVTGTASYNLDSYLMSPETISHLYAKHSIGKDISIIEGVMGLFDGLGNEAIGSAAQLSKQLGLPVVLVVNCKSLYQSVAAIVKGFAMFDAEVNVAGVVLNHVHSHDGYLFLKEYIETHTTVTCIGYLPTDKNIVLESRHLGLVQAYEVDELSQKMELLAATLSKTIDINELITIAETAQPHGVKPQLVNAWQRDLDGLKLGVAVDKAFQFYYRDNLDLLQENGAEICFFSPIADKHLPTDINALYIGGGYPELFADELANNKTMLADIREFALADKPIFAECGGLMYLTNSIVGVDGRCYSMAGVFNCSTVMTKRLQRFGYCSVNFEGALTRAHEFHHSILQHENGNANYEFRYAIDKPEKNKQWTCGLQHRNVLAGYAHFHFLSEPSFYHKIIDLWMPKII
jgi:cobyrinic acid a,c-diamide synthase